MRYFNGKQVGAIDPFDSAANELQ